MAGEKEVKAQVRLRFWNVKRERMVATRNLQVTVKKAGGLTMKTLEGILSKVDGVDTGDKRNAISTKCAEMDAEVPRLMGVSTAILDNVIFCHQEESNWPLSEPSALKKKFDDIFEASKFTKALDHIKSLRKERMAELKVDGERLNFLKQDRDKADNLKKELERHRTDLGRKETESERLTQRHEELTKANAEFYQSSTKFTEIFEKAQALSDKKEMYESNRNNLKKHIKTLMTESDADLRSMMQNFTKDKQEIESKIKDKRQQLEELERDHRTVRGRHSKESQRLGELTANRKRYDRNANERDDIIRILASQHNISGFNGKLSRERVDEFTAILREKVTRSREECGTIEAEWKASDNTLHEEINKLKSEQQSNSSLREDRRKQLHAIKTQMRLAESETESYNTIEFDIKKIEQDIQVLSDRIATTEREIEDAKYEDKIKRLGVDLRQLEATKEEINSEYRAMQKHAEARANLSAARSNLLKVQTRIQEAVQNHGVKYLEVTGETLDPNNMDDPLLTAQRSCEIERDSLSREKQSLLEQRNRWESDIAITKENIERLEMEASRTKKELQTFRNDHLDFTNSNDLNVVMAEVQGEIATVKALLGEGDLPNEITFFEHVQQTAEKENKCLGCDRHFKKSEEAAFKRYLKETFKKLKAAQDIPKLETELVQWQTVESRLRDFITRMDSMRLSSQKAIPEDKQKIREWEAKIQTTAKQIEAIETRDGRVQTKAREVSNLKAYAAVVSRDVAEAEDLKQQITSTERGLEGTGSTKTTEEVQTQMAETDKQIKSKNEERLRVMAERDQLSNRQITDESNLSAKKLSLLEAKNRQASRKQAEGKIEEYKKETKRLNEDIQDLEHKANSYEKPLRLFEAELRENKVKYGRDLLEARLQLDGYVKGVADLKQITDDMKRYEDANGDQLLEDSEKLVRELDRQIAKLDSDISELQQDITSLREDLSNSDQRAQNIDNNISYRQAEHKIEQLKEEIDQIDLEEAARAKQQFDTKYQRAERERTETYGKLQQTVGEISQMKEQARRMQKQLDTDYKNIHGEYIDCLVKWKTGDMANRDLEKYAKALDNGERVVLYHTLKLAEVNKTLDEHWREVYSGTDIDSIQIVSENDAGNTGTRKSYNYRLVMRKGDQSLDMRGRCSAGQKVLASILVRLALADSFAQQCGVLALDEPTTNLDVDNITALAGALANLIDRMKHLKNFQLIVITHDESFLQRLAGNSSSFEYYWRVSRNADQKSIVERQRVVAEY
ncbi:hypothetical protein QFC22_004549 [Naganishia vaughanmartiniae]|uniref:Uncharacterized protein n=1 Tax=Naganishia vaughanmartiniae TaxID=1424756 RepID=A0ACC2X0V4_9TREE|nr:hypothetical protein QFC22_004549 [Naganishia vaughanmartiniae]